MVRKFLFNWKYILFFVLVFVMTLCLVLMRYIDYAVKTQSRMAPSYEEHLKSDKVYSREEWNRRKSRSNVTAFFETMKEIKENFSFTNLNFDYGLAKERMIPVVIIGTLYIFVSLKNRLIKFNIGRNKLYEKEVRKLKRKLAFVAPFYNLFMIICFALISLCVGNGLNFSEHMRFRFNVSGILGSFISNGFIAFIILQILAFICLYLLNLLILNLVNRYGTINGLLITFILLWILPTFLKNLSNIGLLVKKFIPYEMLVNTGSFGGDMYIWLIPILLTGILAIWIDNLDKKDIEII